MEEVRDQEEFKHVCKLCNKRYPSGKSLGGHMRSHVIANANKNKLPISKKALIFDEEQEDDEDEDEEEDEEEDDNEVAGDQVREKENNEGKISGYGLRENPKKTWRLVDSTLRNNKQQQQQQQVLHFQPQNNINNNNNNQQQERVCKQCGKGFHSLKALCGHMSSHSEKERNFKEEDDNSWSSDSKEQLILTMESHSDNNNNIVNNSNNINSKRQTRSSLLRYKSLTTVDYVAGGGGGGSSSNHSEIDQHEQEEIAMCLMMLSRDFSGHKSCFNFTAESSDNNSVILEGGSSSNHVGIAGKRNDFCLIKDNNKKIKQVVVAEEEDVNHVNHQEINNSDSGYFENGAKELESDDSVDGFVRNYGFQKPKIEFGSRNLADSFYDDDSRKRRIREVGNFSFVNSPESDENSSKKIMKQDYYCYNNNNNLTKKGSKYECWVCNKTFKTHQALGGHIISHRKTGDRSLDNTSVSAKLCNPKNVVGSTTAKVMPSKSKKAKGHKCPYCPKVFKSGQALGGHKRSHMIGSNGGFLNLDEKSKIDGNPSPEPEPKQPPLIDLNLPAPMEEEGIGNSQFVAW